MGLVWIDALGGVIARPNSTSFYMVYAVASSDIAAYARLTPANCEPWGDSRTSFVNECSALETLLPFTCAKIG
jgi:hypothetical protein